jgi:hypothetical protein
MNCERIEELLSAYIEGELSAAEKSLVETHLRACRDCTLLYSAITDTRAALSGFPELEISETLKSRLSAIPERKRRFRFSLDFLLKPSLQPVFAAATVFLTLLSFYLFNPDKKYIDRSIDQKIHQGYNQVEKLYAQTGSLTDRLGDYKDSILGSIKNWKIFGGKKDEPKQQEE